MKKKLIEVALPLEAINAASIREKSIRYGHPSTLHLWWARRPLAACRAVLFASLVDDPSSLPEEFPTEAEQQRERQRLFSLIEELVKWENTNNEDVPAQARAEIMKSTGGSPPPVLDPFCGGGSIPLEAQRLGLTAYGSDLNPVAVLITKAMIEIPPRFTGKAAVNPDSRQRMMAEGEWQGAAGLAEDIRYYGRWMRDEAERRIGYLYPPVELPREYGGGKATVIAWLWARTVKCPNPACGAEMPLVKSFWLSTRAGKKAWVEPVIDNMNKKVSFIVKTGTGSPPASPKVGRGAKFKCLVCTQVASDQHIKAEGMSRRMGSQLMAIVAEGEHGRIYLAPSEGHSKLINSANPLWGPEEELEDDPRAIWCKLYGLTKFRDLFNNRKLVALTTFSDLIQEVHQKVKDDAVAAGMKNDDVGIDAGGSGAQAYADAVATYLAIAMDKSVDYWTTICSWHSGRDTIRNTFARQGIPMSWDYAEANPFSNSTGNFLGAVEWVGRAVALLPGNTKSYAMQNDAGETIQRLHQPLVSTDPPYYDNIGYAGISDFFYVWLRRSLAGIYPQLFATMLVPKAEELVATPYRFDGDKQKAKQYFEIGMQRVFSSIRKQSHSDYPITVFYAFKQTESDDSGNDADTPTVASTGWETMLEALLKAGLEIHGTWPMRTELANRTLAKDTNALASSIVLVCRPRPADAPIASRREFVNRLKRELPPALKQLQQGNIAPVDLAQAVIGPGMAVFSSYAQVLEASGQPMSVRQALHIINHELDAYLTAQEGELDAETRFCLAWYEQYGFNEAPYGQADVMTRAKNTAPNVLVEQGVLHAAKGKTRLVKRSELDPNWVPTPNKPGSTWLQTLQLVARLESGGIEKAAELEQQIGIGDMERVRRLTYRLYDIAEKKGWADDALAYNSLIVDWMHIERRAAALKSTSLMQGTILE